MNTANLPTVVIVGRANVGKSTLFNRLAGETKALVSPLPGTTRDLKQANINWRGKKFSLIDTGGITHRLSREKKGGDIQKKIAEHTHRAVNRADLILFVTDSIVGITKDDRLLAQFFLRSQKSPVLLVANKADSPAKRVDSSVFLSLGFGEPLPVSAANGSGTGDLLDVIIEHIGNRAPSYHEETEDPTRICILGKPNVGKSSLFNALLGEPRAIVDDKPHTTREPNDTELIWEEERFLLIDTAGLRRHFKKAGPLERGGTSLTVKTLERADVVWLVVDACDFQSFQDRRLAQMVVASRSACVVVFNKWDCVPDKTPTTPRLFHESFNAFFPHLSWAPIAYTSATNRKGIPALMRTTRSVLAHYQTEIPETALGKILKKAVQHQPPPLLGAKKKRPFLSRAIQTRTMPPEITIHSSLPYRLPEHYIRYLEKRIRNTINLEGSPLIITIAYEHRQTHTHAHNRAGKSG